MEQPWKTEELPRTGLGRRKSRTHAGTDVAIVDLAVVLEGTSPPRSLAPGRLLLKVRPHRTSELGSTEGPFVSVFSTAESQ